MEAKCRGQLSLELLIVFAIFLAVLLIALSSLTRIKGMFDEQHALASAKMALNDVADAADEVCVMGEGNRRVVALDSQQIALSLPSPRNLTASLGNVSMSRALLCDAQLSGAQISEKAIIENVAGSIMLSG